MLRKQVVQYRMATRATSSILEIRVELKQTVCLKSNQFILEQEDKGLYETGHQEKIMGRLPDVFDNVERTWIVLSESLQVEISTQETKQNSKKKKNQWLTLGKTKSCKRDKMESQNTGWLNCE